MEYEYLVVSVREGKNKDTQKPYHFVELHDPKTLKSGMFSVKEGIVTDGLNPRDRVKVSFDIELNAWNTRLTLASLKKVG